MTIQEYVMDTTRHSVVPLFKYGRCFAQVELARTPFDARRTVLNIFQEVKCACTTI